MPLDSQSVDKLAAHDSLRTQPQTLRRIQILSMLSHPFLSTEKVSTARRPTLALGLALKAMARMDA